MMFLAGQIIVFVVASFLIGFFLGWAVKNFQAKQLFKRIEKMYQINLSSVKSKSRKSL